ncbi:unnamed protein product [Arabis nemorensis]|uniref:DUF2828 domain-containing protein n=1 Tax=Arabis nemorensis TaxID=586526 RepID=A0A565CMM0_9BRAS|nr:unnamed protein product [Arabis nemorensis]
MASPLLGPPELRHSNSNLPEPTTDSGPSMELIVSSFNKSTIVNDDLSSPPPMGQTRTSPCLDFFFHVVPSTPKESLEDRLYEAWNHDALTTLKLVCNLRGGRGTGKSDKEGFYTAALWLHDYHPKTLACNLESLSKFGYFKDFPEILYRILQGHEIRKTQKSEWKQRKMALRSRGSTRSEFFSNRVDASRKDKKVLLGKEAYTRSPEKRYGVFDLRRNKQDLSKWCPSIDSCFDRATLICESIAKKLFPRESFPEYEGVEEAHYAYRVRDRLRKQVLVPLRKTLQLPEVYMGASDWNSLPYNRVASVAMKSYKEIFLKRDAERFQQYLEDARSGKTKIAAGAVLPHEIIGELNGGDGGQVAELQWKRMVDDMRKKGSLTNCIAISDVSGSMRGTPMEVAVALGLLVSESSEDPWRGKLITFSENPELHLVKGDDLRRKTEFVRRMEWDMNTDFQKVFDLILKVAVEGRVKPEEMIKRVFVFSDMEFDQARVKQYRRYGGCYQERNGGWETDYEAIMRKYRENGYGEAVPEIVFWNLRNSGCTPVTGSEKGVALVSGFSKNLIKMFLDNDGGISPMKMMEAAISGEEYETLVVIENDVISNKPTRYSKGKNRMKPKVISRPKPVLSFGLELLGFGLD